MNRIQFATVTLLGALGLALMAGDATLGVLNRSLQGDIALRQQYVQQSVQLEGLYREIVRALAELGARHNDEAVRSLLQRHGITYSVSAAAAPAPAGGTRK